MGQIKGRFFCSHPVSFCPFLGWRAWQLSHIPAEERAAPGHPLRAEPSPRGTSFYFVYIGIFVLFNKKHPVFVQFLHWDFPPWKRRSQEPVWKQTWGWILSCLHIKVQVLLSVFPSVLPGTIKIQSIKASQELQKVKKKNPKCAENQAAKFNSQLKEPPTPF